MNTNLTKVSAQQKSIYGHNNLLGPIANAAYKKKKSCFIAVVLLQIAIMCSIAVSPAMTLLRGKTITLKTLPVDPYDMFRGDYVRLRYKINDAKVAEADRMMTNGSDVYVAVYQHGPDWYPRLACTTRPRLWPGEVCIKGKYDGYQVRYGIEQVFVPEKTGHTAERAKSLSVDVAVDAHGNSVIKRVINGQETIYDARQVIFGRPQGAVD